MGVFVNVKGDGVYPEKSNLCCMCFLCNDFCPVHAITVRWNTPGLIRAVLTKSTLTATEPPLNGERAESDFKKHTLLSPDTARMAGMW